MEQTTMCAPKSQADGDKRTEDTPGDDHEARPHETNDDNDSNLAAIPFKDIFTGLADPYSLPLKNNFTVLSDLDDSDNDEGTGNDSSEDDGKDCNYSCDNKDNVGTCHNAGCVRILTSAPTATRGKDTCTK